MRKSKFTEAQIIAILNQAEGGAKVAIWLESTGSAPRRFTTGAPSTAAWT